MGIFEEETCGMGWLLQEQALGSPHPSPLAEFGLSSPTLKYLGATMAVVAYTA